MIVTFQKTQLGLELITISADPKAPSLSSPKSPPCPRRQVRAFSSKAQRRLKEAAAALDLNPQTSFFTTLKFHPGTSPKQANKLRKKLFRWLRAAFPGASGIYSIEFKNVLGIHYHALLLFSWQSATEAQVAREALKSKWSKLAGIDPEETYMEPISDPANAIKYLCKNTAQRKVPQCFEGEMTRFWGTFGKLPLLPRQILYLPDSAQREVRESLASSVATQMPNNRAIPFASALAQSTGKISAFLSTEDAEELKREAKEVAST